MEKRWSFLPIVSLPDCSLAGNCSSQKLSSRAKRRKPNVSSQCVVFRSRRPGLDINPSDGQRVAIQTELPYYAD
jgi:hypothetical protein